MPVPAPKASAAALRAAGSLKLTHLRVIATIGRHRNAHRAGAELGLSQPAISKIVREAEAVVGAALFERGRQGMHPNRLGEALLARAIGILNDLDSAQSDVEAMIGGTAGHLRLGVIPFVTPALISGTLQALSKAGVDLSLSIHEDTTGELVGRLLRRELDCLIARFSTEREAELEQRLLYHQKFSAVVACTHPALGGRRRVRLRDTLSYGWIVPPPRTAARQLVSALFVQSGLPPPPIRIETSSLEVIKAALADSDMVAILPTDIAHHHARLEQLRVLPFRTDTVPAPLTLITRRNDHVLPAVARFRDTLTGVAARRPEARARRAV